MEPDLVELEWLMTSVLLGHPRNTAVFAYMTFFFLRKINLKITACSRILSTLIFLGSLSAEYWNYLAGFFVLLATPKPDMVK
jgi:hypothetical protein